MTDEYTVGPMSVDDMPAGPALDAQVAEKVMGWRVLTAEQIDPNIGENFTTPFVSWVRSHDKYVAFRKRDDYLIEWRSLLWSPSTDIAAAWEVLEKLGQPFNVWSAGTKVSLDERIPADIRNDPKVQTWLRDLGDIVSREAKFMCRIGGVVSAAQTAPLAIARAALEAMEQG